MILEYGGTLPDIDPEAFIEQTAIVIGDVVIGAKSSVWFYAVVRGDENYIRVGEKTNIQDGTVVHVTHDTGPTNIGSETTIGHRAIIHGCAIGDHSLIGMGATILDGAEIGDHCLVAAGAVVPPGLKAKSGSLVVGVPAKVVGEVKQHHLDLIDEGLHHYSQLGAHYPGRNTPRPGK